MTESGAAGVPVSVTDAVMTQALQQEPTVDGVYLLFNIAAQAFLTKKEFYYYVQWDLQKYEEAFNLQEHQWTVLQVPYHPDRVYMVFGEASFLDTHGPKYKPHVWDGHRDGMGLQDIIDANMSAGAPNLWWNIKECTEGLPGGPTFEIENPHQRVHLATKDMSVVCDANVAGEEPGLRGQWLFVPIENVDMLSQAMMRYAASVSDSVGQAGA